jgi:prevent-host-death family protein
MINYKEVKNMPQIRPVSDLRNNFADISKIVHETSEPVFLTKNGYGDMVVMSMEAFEHHQFESEVYFKLKEAELEARMTEKRYSHKEVFDELRTKFSDSTESEDV